MQTKRRPGWMIKVFDAYGGRERFFDFFAAVSAQMKTVNLPQTDEIAIVSRVLHAHLMTERFLTRYLQYIYPRSKPVQNAGLSFSQKVDRIDPADSSVSFLISGLRRLDLIRNRLAGDSPTAVTEQDRKALLAVPLFKEVLDSAACAPARRNQDAASVMECFAAFAGILLHNAADPEKKLQAYARSAKKPAAKRHKK